MKQLSCQKVVKVYFWPERHPIDHVLTLTPLSLLLPHCNLNFLLSLSPSHSFSLPISTHYPSLSTRPSLPFPKLLTLPWPFPIPPRLTVCRYHVYSGKLSLRASALHSCPVGAPSHPSYLMTPRLERGDLWMDDSWLGSSHRSTTSTAWQDVRQVTMHSQPPSNMKCTRSLYIQYVARMM